MILEFKPPKNATVYDICLNTYGSLDLLFKLLDDNNIDDLNLISEGNETYFYEYDLVSDYTQYQTIQRDAMKFTTGDENIFRFFHVPNFILIENTDELAAEDAQDFLVEE